MSRSVSLIVLLLVGCAGRIESNVRSRATQEMACEEVTMTPNPQPIVSARGWTVTGCEKQAYYEGGCTILGICKTYDEQEIAQREQQRLAQNEAMRPQPSSGAAAGGGPVSVTMRNTCGSTVKLFYGDKPGYSSGRTDTLSSNSSMSASFREGDTIWIVDDSNNGVSSYRVPSGVRTLEVGCTSIAGR